MSRMSAAVTGLCAVLAMVGVFASANSDSPLTVVQIADGIYLHRGAYVDLDDAGRADSANIGFIVGTRCVAVIDSGGALATGRALATTIAGLTDRPVCYVINTHVHFDHVLGNAAWRGADVEFVGHAALAEAMAANREFFAESFASELGGPGHGAEVIAPTLLVTDEMTLDLGGREVLLRAVATAHTTADLTVLDLKTNTLWTGDLLFRERMPVVDGSLKGWLAWMERVMTQSYGRVVPGHGPVDDAWPAGAAPQLRYFKALLDDTRRAIAAGEFLDEAQSSVARDEPAQWQLPARAHRLNVSRVYRELEWE